MHLTALIPSFLISVFVPRGRDKRRWAELRRLWGQEISRERDMDVIAMYHASIRTDQSAVDQQTWQDLNMDDLFAKIDRTTGMPGRQVLYHQMRTYLVDDLVLAERARQQLLFRDNQPLREQIQVWLARLDAPGGQWLAYLLLNPFPEPPGYAPLLYLCSFLSVVCVVAIPFVHLLFPLALLFLFVNMAITARFSNRILPYFSGFTQIVSMLSVSEKLASISESHALPQIDYLRKSIPLVGRLRKKLGWLVMDRKALPDLVEAAINYLNFFLFDTIVYLRSLATLRKHQTALVGIMEAVGSLDASIAVASYLQDFPGATRPTLVQDHRLEVVGLTHPLLANPVSNSFALTHRSALIAGPNMAGKTAFIRTVGINVILSQTFNFCLAERAVLPRAKVRSAIRREDDLQTGQSYFFAEIQQILEFTRAASEDQCSLFLVDEIFRGTNTIERIATAAAVLRHLGQRQIVLATTHDVELQELLADTFDMYHFSDQVVDGRYSFGYHIASGPARSRNAIKLLEISGYPNSIIQEAEALAASPAAKATS
jgi:hypothetical protein